MPKIKNTKDYTAALAGKQETWKDWAGREEGGDAYQLFDVLRNWRKKRKVKKIFNKIANEGGEECPVCYSTIQNQQDWFVTKSCLHGCCKDCVVAFLKTQINDHNGNDEDALKCAICNKALTEADTIKAFRHDEELVKAWDIKMRNNILRKALRNFRPCPHCEGNGDGSFGGGFVSAECLESVISKRYQDAAQMLTPWKGLMYFVLVMASIYKLNNDTDWSGNIITIWCTYRGYILLRLFLATYIQDIILQPIDVDCPCCAKSFVLNTEAEMTKSTNPDKGMNEHWIRDNCKPCPGCSSPVEKNGGCNHMHCAQCNTDFCWVCMQAGRKCGAYNCVNRPGTAKSAEVSSHQSPQNQFVLEQMKLERYKMDVTGMSFYDFLALGLFAMSYFGIPGRGMFYLLIFCLSAPLWLAFFLIIADGGDFMIGLFLLGSVVAIAVAGMVGIFNDFIRRRIRRIFSR